MMVTVVEASRFVSGGINHSRLSMKIWANGQKVLPSIALIMMVAIGAVIVTNV